MEYSHSDRLEGFRNLYMTVVGETKSLYEAKEQWEFISDNLDDSYFWTALEDMYQNELVELNNFEISSSGEFDPDNFCMEEYDELNRVRVPKEWDLEAENISVFTDHFERHDQPGSDDYDLGYPICSLEVKRRIHKGDKSIEYLLQNDSESGEASLKLEVGFNIPNFFFSRS